MENTLGKRISSLRREKGMKQEELAEKMGVSPQAVSKWENDQTCPDISALPQLAKLLGISVDELLTGKKEEPCVRIIPVDEQSKDRILHVYITDGGDRIKVNIPMPLIRKAVEIGLSLPEISGNNSLKNLDLESILSLVDQGLVGELVEIEGDSGENIRIFVE